MLELRNNPIYQRERLAFSRGKLSRYKANTMRAFFIIIGILSFFALLVDFEILIANIVISGLIFQLAAVIFFLPPVASTRLIKERESQTLDVLLTTTITPHQLILGKLGGGIIYMASLIFAVAPLYVLAIFLWFLEWAYFKDVIEIFWGFLLLQFIIGIWMLLWSVLSFYLSIFFKSSQQVSIAIYVLAGVKLIFLPILLEFIPFNFLFESYYLYDWVTLSLSIPHILIHLLDYGYVELAPLLVFALTYMSFAFLLYLLSVRAISKRRQR
ncbi:MAG: hypothetical protein AAF633_01515 [Chloroflexota bacterium]